ncbi:PfkB family carbohydrate kinase [Microbacterium awajiense]|uniref:PfkB family carbohydrate kinase n=1 Tax=Microbacterium awajiense TaxID=415214 RepID=A0ABP7A470_9MICO
MLTVIGDLIDDVIVRRPGALERGTDNPAVIRHTRGGSAANVAAAAAPLSPARFIGRVGRDAAGDSLVAALQSAGVDARVQRGERTGTIVILVDDDGERTMITDRASAADLEPIEQSWLDGTSWLHLPLYGFTSESSRGALLAAAAWAARSGVPVSIDLSSTALMRELGAPVLAGILADVVPDVVFANTDEDGCLAELGLEPPSDAVYIVKRGPAPVLLVVGGTCTEVAVEPVADVVDSTGAGDAFAAGYLAGAREGRSPRDCVLAGIVLAAGAVQGLGALPG